MPSLFDKVLNSVLFVNELNERHYSFLRQNGCDLLFKIAGVSFRETLKDILCLSFDLYDIDNICESSSSSL